MFEKYQNIIVLDIETTGLDCGRDKIIEFAAIKAAVNEGRIQVIDEISVLVNPGFELPAKITEITNITTEMVVDKGITEMELLSEIANFVDEGSLIMAYNTQFDISFINELFNRANLSNLDNDLLDVMAVYKDHYRYPHRLKSAIETLGVDAINSHRALDDVMATLKVFINLSAKVKSVNAYINTFGFNAKYGVMWKKIPKVTYTPQKGGYKEIENNY